MHADPPQKYIWTYIYTHTYTHMQVHIHTHTCIHIYIYIYIQIHIHTYMDTYTYTSAHTCTYTYIYIHMPIHTYIYISTFIAYAHPEKLIALSILQKAIFTSLLVLSQLFVSVWSSLQKIVYKLCWKLFYFWCFVKNYFYK